LPNNEGKCPLVFTKVAMVLCVYLFFDFVSMPIHWATHRYGQTPYQFIIYAILSVFIDFMK